MSEKPVRNEGASIEPRHEATDQPAVCFDVRGEPDSLPAAILRAYQHGYQVFVIPPADDDSQVTGFANQLDATIVEPNDRMSEGNESLIERLTNVAQRQGFPGLIYQQLPSTPIDYELTAARFDSTSEYCVAAVSDTGASPTVVAGIPAYNEATSIGSIVIETKAHADEVIVIDDGSTDRTAELADEAGAIVIEHDRNEGKGAALQTLFRSLQGQEFDALILLDADGQHAPADIPEVVEPVLKGEADLVVGSRYLEQSQDDETPQYRRIGQRVLDLLTFGSSKARVSDSQSGFRALSPQVIEHLSIDATGFAVESEMIDSAARQDFTIVERPIEVRYEGLDSGTQNPLRHGLAVVAFILYLIRDRHPLLFFAVPGLLLTLAGMGYGIDGILIYRSTGAFYPAKVFVSGFLMIIGVLGVFTGLVLNRMTNMMREFEQRQSLDTEASSVVPLRE